MEKTKFILLTILALVLALALVVGIIRISFWIACILTVLIIAGLIYVVLKYKRSK